MRNSGLPKQDIEAIREVCTHHPQIKKVMLYGSRAMDNYKPYSDIDLTIIGDNIDLSLLVKIEHQLDDLMLPYKIDLSVFSQISNPDLIEHIKREGKTFYEKERTLTKIND